METNRSAAVIEDNLKKALAELLVLAMLHHRDYYALELNTALSEYSGGAINLTFPYAILYRMIDQGYIQELPRRRAPDGRRRQYFGITDTGRQYFQDIWSVYKTFTSGVDRLIAAVLSEEGGE